MFTLKRILNIIWDRWPYLLLFLAGLLVSGLLLGINIGTLTNGASSAEINYSSQIGLKKTIDNPINAPYKIIALALSKFFNILLALRLTSAFFGMVFIWLFYLVLRNWHTRRIAILGTLLFATSTWFLHAARIGLPNIAWLMPIGMLAYGIFALKSKKFELNMVLAVAVFALTLYTPGMVWFLAALIAWQGKRALTALSHVNILWRIGGVVLLVAALTPLVYAAAFDHSLIRIWLGLPRVLPDVYSFLNNLLNIPLSLFIGFRDSADIWLSGVPVLDIFGATMLLLGLYAYFFKLGLDRGKFIAGALVLSGALVALGGVHLVALLPYLALIITSGFTLMMQQWFTVFPRNPLARAVALILVITLVSLSVFYQLNRYFVAWPNAPETKQAFVQQP